ncbi:MAG: ferric reductase-like transmembrane domain-containing protein [Rhizobiaceae bacterium]|nr:ferric reductase-like transmembrane domain-containing protein [Rhizobiaceae bacterium]
MIGTFAIYFLLFVAFILSIPAASHTGLETWGSLAASSTAFVAMALNQFLATRPKFLEAAFGGLDRIYHLHKKLGMLALALILLHYFVTPNFEGKVLASSTNKLAKEVGEYAYWGFIVLIGFSLVKKIPFTKFEFPYHWWRQSHRFIGVFFIAIAFHQMFIKRPFDGNALLANYLNIFAAIGILSFLYTQFARFFRGKAYVVTSVNRLPAATVVEAAPVSSMLGSVPGQFAFIGFKKSGLREPHPFTLAGRGENGEVKFAIKALGDFTKRLRENIAVGDQLKVEGGYGRFRFDPKQRRQLWLAGGIGVTPFLAMAKGLKPDLEQKICLVHCVRNAEEAIEGEMLLSQAKSIENFQYVLFDSKTSGRIDTEKLGEIADFDLDGAEMLFCGPPPLRAAIVSGMKKQKIKFSRVRFELFEFR